MIKARRIFKTLHIEAESATVKDLFKTLTRVDEVFGEKCCGVCKSEEIRFTERKSVSKKTKKEFVYYEMRCVCGARLCYGQSEDTENLFPKRKIKNGDKEVYDVKNKGWSKYNPNDDKNEEEEETT